MSTQPSSVTKPSASSAPSAPSLLLDQQLCFPLYAASNLIIRAYGSLLKPLGLTYPQYLVMMVLWEVGEASVGELGERLYLDSGTLTPLLKRMEAAGHLRRQRSPEDERRVLVQLTPAGMALKEPAQRVPEAMACRVAADNAWLQRLRNDLNTLLATLNN